jgi:hypothetical protein
MAKPFHISNILNKQENLMSKIKTNLIIFTYLTLFFINCIKASECKISEGEISGLKTIAIQNSLVSFEVIPSSCGRIASVKFLTENTECILPYKEEGLNIDPLLPTIIKSNRSGFKEWFWKEKYIEQGQMSIKQEGNKNKLKLTLSKKHYMSLDIDLTRQMTLVKDSSKIVIRSAVKNIGKVPLNTSLWLNNIPQLGSKNQLTIVPTKAVNKSINERAVIKVQEDELITIDGKSESSTFCAPARNWIARIDPENKISLVTRTDFKNLTPEGLFYIWQGKGIATKEIIFTPKVFKKGKEENYSYEMMIVKGLTFINEICGDIAMQVAKDNDKFILILSAVSKQNAQKLTITITPDISTPRKTTAFSCNVPELKPCKVYRVELPESVKFTGRAKGKIAGKFSKTGAFDLIPFIIK